MQNSAYLINVSRGSIVNQNALITALKEREIAGAAIDVFEDEPEVPDDLLKFSNVVLTPHIGSTTVEAKMSMIKESTKKIMEVLKGNIPDDLVNKNNI